MAALLLAGQPTPVQRLGVGHGTRCPLGSHVEQREHAREMLDLREELLQHLAGPRALAWQEALTRYAAIDAPEAREIRARLATAPAGGDDSNKPASPRAGP